MLMQFSDEWKFSVCDCLQANLENTVDFVHVGIGNCIPFQQLT